ncbi:MAG TPA: M20/M25/M40 family metallo-hydrolase, partial [Thermomicrobiales bacterium]|nr:M20/M25/M40 family metallo-hydrolase [Thermomicrobiales bacterium]
MPIDAAALPDLLSRLVGIDSTNPDLVPGGPGEGEIARVVADWRERGGLDVAIEEAAPGRPNVIGVARGSGGGRTLMLNAHTDTVGAGGMDAPFTPRIEGDRLFGRGAFDMKGSLAAIMLVAAAAKRANLRGDLIVTAVCDEEYASIGTQAIAERCRADAAIVTEPTDLDLVIAHKGFIWHAVETRGVAAHGSLPEAGVDAIAKMGPVLLGVQALDQALREQARHPLLGTASIHASLIAGGQELSSYPASCRLEIERRTLPGETVELATRQLELLLDGVRRADNAFAAELTTMLARDPFAIAPDADIVQLV